VHPARVVGEIQHQLRQPTHERRRAKGTTSRHHGNGVASLENARSLRSVSMERHAHETIGVGIHLRELIHVFQVEQHWYLRRRLIRQEVDPAAQCRRLYGHAEFHPPRRKYDDVGKFLDDSEVRVKPHFRIKIVVHMADPQISRHPGAIDDEGNGHAICVPRFRQRLEQLPLFDTHRRPPSQSIVTPHSPPANLGVSSILERKPR